MAEEFEKEAKSENSENSVESKNQEIENPFQAELNLSKNNDDWKAAMQASNPQSSVDRFEKKLGPRQENTPFLILNSPYPASNSDAIKTALNGNQNQKDKSVSELNNTERNKNVDPKTDGKRQDEQEKKNSKNQGHKDVSENRQHHNHDTSNPEKENYETPDKKKAGKKDGYGNKQENKNPEEQAKQNPDYFPLAAGLVPGANPFAKFSEGTKKTLDAISELGKASDEIPESKNIKVAGEKAKQIVEKAAQMKENDPNAMKDLAKDLKELQSMIKNMSANDLNALMGKMAGKLTPEEIKMLANPQGLVLDTLAKSLEKGVLPVAEKLQPAKDPNIHHVEQKKELGSVNYKDYCTILNDKGDTIYMLKPASTPSVSLQIDNKKEELPLDFPGAKMGYHTNISMAAVTGEYNSKTGEKGGPIQIIATVRKGDDVKQYTLNKVYNNSGSYSWAWTPRK